MNITSLEIIEMWLLISSYSCTINDKTTKASFT